MKTEAEVRERLAYQKGIAEGLRLSKESRADEKEKYRFLSEATIDILNWVLNEDDKNKA